VRVGNRATAARLPSPALARTLPLVCLLVLVAAAPASAATLPPGFDERVLADGLDAPTAVALAPDGRLFVAEKAAW
jgi:glucose/arabinose dehydrogenase